jgi:hypothetical protein
MEALSVRHWDVTDSEIRPVVPVPTPTEIAASLPSEAVQYDLANPPLAGSVQRDPEGQSR